MSREEKIAETFVELADTLVDDFDLIDFLQQLLARCRDIFTVADAAVLLAYPGQRFHSPAPCDPSHALQQVLDLATREGPGRDAYQTGDTVAPGRLTEAPPEWNDFATHARAQGYTHACAVPLRLRGTILGSLLLLSTTEEPLPPEDLVVARAFAASATIGLLHARTVERSETVNEQLHTALHSRIVIEQSKGLLASRHSSTLDHAFDTMRQHARSHQLLLTSVARHIIDTGDLPRTAPPPATPKDAPPA
ncbi:ANTAR domain-containing protein [Streptomyces sp. NPDC048172]|uniref:ANTAR domain-containing protein n=1 Tax=Streptomyces sp. NPDC048172 TaxID=3365505 RepID=UPI0037212094